MVGHRSHSNRQFSCGPNVYTNQLTARKITDHLVKALPAPERSAKVVYDADLKGFGVRVTPAGARAFILTYRTRLGRQRRYTIGAFPAWKTAAARAEATELKRRVDRGGDPLGELKAGRAAPKVSDLCDRFEAEYLPRKRPSTQTSYRQQIAGEIRPALGHLRVAEVSFSDLDALHRDISKRAPYRANRVLALVSRMFTVAIKWHWRLDNPAKGIERNQEHKRGRYLSSEEITRLIAALDAAEDQQSANIVRLALLTGARRGEILQARWLDFDLSAGTAVWSKPGATTKQKTRHDLPLSAAAVQLLTAIKERVAGEWVFPAANGSHRKDVKDSWASLCRAAGIEGARYHDLRHTYASVLASAGLSLPIIGKLLGHTTAQTTHRYVHLVDSPLRAAAERASAIITGKPAAKVVSMRARRRRG